jgi:hypothetical protein
MIPNFVLGSCMRAEAAVTKSSSDKTSGLATLACEEIVNLYLKDVDRSLIRENLLLTYTERLQRLQRNARAANKIRGVAIRPRKSQ